MNRKKLNRVKKNFLPEGKKAGLVILGLATGALVHKGIDMFTAGHPQRESWAKWLKPLITAGGGIVIASAADENSNGKYLGYGIAGAGGLAGLKLLPFTDNLLSGLEDMTTPTLPESYYTESLQKLSQVEGLSDRPVQSLETPPAAAYELDLPGLGEVTEQQSPVEVEGAEDEENFSGII